MSRHRRNPRLSESLLAHIRTFPPGKSQPRLLDGWKKKNAKHAPSRQEAESSESESDYDVEDTESSQPLTATQSSQLVAAVGLIPPMVPAPQGINQTRLVEKLEAPIITSKVLFSEELRKVFFRGKVATFNQTLFAATGAGIQDSPRFMRQIFCGNPKEADANRNFARTYFKMDINRDDSLKQFFITLENLSTSSKARPYTHERLIKSMMDKICGTIKQAAFNMNKPYRFMCELRDVLLSATAEPDVAAALESEWLVEPVTADSRKLNILLYKNLVDILPKEVGALYRALYPLSNGLPAIGDRSYARFLLDFEERLKDTLIALEEGRDSLDTTNPAESRTYGGKMMDSLLSKRSSSSRDGGDDKRKRFDSGKTRARGGHETGDITCHKCGRRGHRSYECPSKDDDEDKDRKPPPRPPTPPLTGSRAPPPQQKAAGNKGRDNRGSGGRVSDKRVKNDKHVSFGDNQVVFTMLAHAYANLDLVRCTFDSPRGAIFNVTEVGLADTGASANVIKASTLEKLKQANVLLILDERERETRLQFANGQTSLATRTVNLSFGIDVIGIRRRLVDVSFVVYEGELPLPIVIGNATLKSIGVGLAEILPSNDTVEALYMTVDLSSNDIIKQSLREQRQLSQSELREIAKVYQRQQRTAAESDFEKILDNIRGYSFTRGRVVPSAIHRFVRGASGGFCTWHPSTTGGPHQCLCAA
jgi:hypothetical protein